MKNLAKILAMALLVGLFGVVAVQSLLATPSIQTPLVATTSYKVETGIRWNEGFKVFEVFNANGVSYIASGEQFNAIGEKYDPMVHESTGFETADGTKTYNIMQDIAYNETDTANQEINFLGGTRHSITTGAVNGRGFILKNFPIIASETAGTALFRSNSGTIQNLTIENAIYTDGTDNTGILVYENEGVIDSCEVKGTAINLNTTVINIAPIAYTGTGTIRNCVNRLNITTAGQYVAGIIARSLGSVYDSKNLANIKSTAEADAFENEGSFAGGIAAIATGGEFLNCINYGNIEANDAGGILGSCMLSSVKANLNFGSIIGKASACGIIGGATSVVFSDGNQSFGAYEAEDNEDGSKTHPIALNSGEAAMGKYGMYYSATLKGFLIDSMIGFSYIGSSKFFNFRGEMQENEASGYYQAASTDTKYFLASNIEYSSLGVGEIDLFTTAPLTLGKNSTLDGQSFSLVNFPIRQIESSTAYTAVFASIETGATVRNLKVTVDSSAIESSAKEIGLFAHANNGTIQTCEVSGTAINTNNEVNIAGIVYRSKGSILSSTNRINLSSGGKYVGGIVGISEGATISNCENKGNIESKDILDNALTSLAGGIAAMDTNGTFTGNFNSGTISAYDAGGILGNCVDSIVNANTNEADIIGVFTACGIIGGIIDTITHSNNTNTGELIALRTSQSLFIRGEYTVKAVPETNELIVEDLAGLACIGSGYYYDFIGNRSEEEIPYSVWAGGGTSDSVITFVITKDMAFSDEITPITLGDYSIVEGRLGGIANESVSLSNFAISVVSGTTYTALFASVGAGAVVKNINLSVDTTTLPTVASEIGLFAYTNSGTIHNCEVSGDAVVTSEAINIASVAYSGGGTITETDNRVNITTNGTHAAGILAISTGSSTITNCTNYGEIKIGDFATRTTPSFAGGIAAEITGGIIQYNENRSIITANDAGGILGISTSATISNNTNSGLIVGKNSACGIVGGELANDSVSSNTNTGETLAIKTAEEYLGDSTTVLGISYKPNYYGEGNGAFVIGNMAGLSYLGSNLYFDTTGSLTDSSEAAFLATDENVKYVIASDIKYNEISVYKTSVLSFGANVTIDGRKGEFEAATMVVDEPSEVADGTIVTLAGFPIRQIGESTTYSALFESIANTSKVENIKLSIVPTDPSTDEAITVGLFSHTNNGTIKNCELGSETPLGISTAKKRSIGGFAYTNEGSHNTTFINCTNNVSINTASINLGGIIAFSNSTIGLQISGCNNNGALTSTGSQGSVDVGTGGIAGIISIGTVVNSHNKAAVTFNGHYNVGPVGGLGGIVGIVNSSGDGKTIFTGCTNNAALNRTGGSHYLSGTGGIVGRFSGTGAFVDCENKLGGDILRTSQISMIPRIGGIVGFLTVTGGEIENISSVSDPMITISEVVGVVFMNCKNFGRLGMTSNNVYGIRVGGIIGDVGSLVDGDVHLIKCANEGEFVFGMASQKVETFQVGGLFGYVSLATKSLTLSDCLNTASIEYRGEWTGAVPYIGGVLGLIASSGGSLIVSNVQNDGNITVGSETVYWTGTFAGAVTGTINGKTQDLESLVCSGSGVARSGKMVGNYTYPESD